MCHLFTFSFTLADTIIATFSFMPCCDQLLELLLMSFTFAASSSGDFVLSLRLHCIVGHTIFRLEEVGLLS